ncbi:Uncharacterised protein [Mycobacteroides abscessus subsp. massiliense]|nr:Uncharacterised protein [Mycobacteroides abscessus subsp. massiliense]
MAQPGAQRGATRDGGHAFAAERRTQLAVDQLVEGGALGAQHDARAALVQRLAVFDGGVRGGVENLSLAVVLGVLAGGVVDLLKDAGHRDDEGRLEDPEGRHQGLDITGESHADLGLEAGHRDTARQYVGQRQEDQRTAALL